MTTSSHTDFDAIYRWVDQFRQFALDMGDVDGNAWLFAVKHRDDPRAIEHRLRLDFEDQIAPSLTLAERDLEVLLQKAIEVSAELRCEDPGLSDFLIDNPVRPVRETVEFARTLAQDIYAKLQTTPSSTNPKEEHVDVLVESSGEPVPEQADDEATRIRRVIDAGRNPTTTRRVGFAGGCTTFRRVRTPRSVDVRIFPKASTSRRSTSRFAACAFAVGTRSEADRRNPSTRMIGPVTLPR